MSYDNLARIYRGLHNYQEALIYHDSAISISEERFGQMHSRLAVLYHNKSLTLQDASRYEEALEYANKALTIELLTSAPNSPSLVKTYFSLGSSYASLNNYEKSLVYYQKAILIQENENINYPLLVKIYRGAIPIYDKLGENKIALEYQIKLLDLEEHKVTTSNADLGISYNELGRFYNNLKNYSAAIRSYSRSVELSPELKKSHFYLNIGVAYCDNSQFTEAFTAFKNYEKLFPNKPISFCNWVIYYSLKRDKVNALANLEKALRLGFSNKNFLMTNHRFNYIRKEPVFIKLIQEMK